MPRFLRRSLALVVALCAVGDLARAADALGRRERLAGSLVGIFYDLKQDQRRRPIPDAREGYAKALDEFVADGFDEGRLNRFFRAALPLYTTDFWVENLNADFAPRAFGVESVVQPSLWVIHYKGQISPPEDGVYRFVGSFDDVLVVAVDRKVVLVGNLPDTVFPRTAWKQPADAGPLPLANRFSIYGDWMRLRADRPVDVDILVGERPGGHFYGALLYEKRGETYRRDAEGKVVLPLFQVAPRDHRDPRFLSGGAVWKCWE